MTVKDDANAPPLAAVTSSSDNNNSNNNNDDNAAVEIPLAEAIPIPITTSAATTTEGTTGTTGVVPVPPPPDSKVVKKTTKTTKTYTIPAPSTAAETPSAPPMANNNNSSVVTAGTPVTSAASAAPAATDGSKLLSDLGRQPVSITCPHCGQVGLTRVESRCDAGSGASAVLLGAVGCFCCICLAFAALLPCCVDKMKETEHRCGKCNRVVGKVRSFSDC